MSKLIYMTFLFIIEVYGQIKISYIRNIDCFLWKKKLFVTYSLKYSLCFEALKFIGHHAQFWEVYFFLNLTKGDNSYN